MSDLIKTKFAGVYYKEDSQTKVKTYIVRINIRGLINTEQIVGYSNDAIRTNPSLAYQKRIELINQLKNGESIRAQDNPTLKSYFDDYMERKEKGRGLSIKKIGVYRSFFKNHIPSSLKNTPLKKLTRDHFQKVIDTMANNGHKGSFIETIKTCFSPIFNDAADKGLIQKNIIKGLKFPKYDSNKYFSLQEDTVKALVQEIMNIANNDYRLMFMFLLRGRRQKEVLTLQWENINFEKKTYTIPDTQSKIDRTLTFIMDDELLEHFSFLKLKKSGFVFISPKTGDRYFSIPMRVWHRIRDKLELKMTLHDFRHLLGFTLVNNNVPLEQISRALGHSKITTTQRYSNQKEQMAKQAVDVFLGIIK